LGLDRAAGRALRHDLDPGARLHRPLHAGHHQVAVDLVPADPPRARGSRLDLWQGAPRHHPHHRAAARAPRHRRRHDAPFHPGDPRARLLAVPLHQRHHRDGGAAARLLRGRQYREDRGVQPGADRAARGADRRRRLALERPRRRQRRPLGMRGGNTKMGGRSMKAMLTALALSTALAAPAVPAAAQDFGPPQLIAAAQAEGKLVYYTANFAEVEQEVIKAFNKRFPEIRVEMVRAPGGQLITRVKTEAAAGKLAADVVDHSDRALMSELTDLFQDYAPPNAADYRPDAMISPKLWPRATLVWSIAYNSALVKNPP